MWGALKNPCIWPREKGLQAWGCVTAAWLQRLAASLKRTASIPLSLSCDSSTGTHHCLLLLLELEADVLCPEEAEGANLQLCLQLLPAPGDGQAACQPPVGICKGTGSTSAVLSHTSSPFLPPALSQRPSCLWVPQPPPQALFSKSSFLPTSSPRDPPRSGQKHHKTPIADCIPLTQHPPPLTFPSKLYSIPELQGLPKAQTPPISLEIHSDFPITLCPSLRDPLTPISS